MKEWQVKYYLGDMLHTYVVDAENEYRAILNCLHKMPDTSYEIMHDFKIERYYRQWN